MNAIPDETRPAATIVHSPGAKLILYLVRANCYGKPNTGSAEMPWIRRRRLVGTVSDRRWAIYRPKRKSQPYVVSVSAPSALNLIGGTSHESLPPTKLAACLPHARRWVRRDYVPRYV